jgi:hypothetical protein
MYVEYNRDIIRIIMSKFEILQNSKIDSELGKMIEYIPKWYGFNKLINFQKARSDIVSISLLE